MPSPNSVVLNRDEYHYVNLGPKSGVPEWHEQAKPSRYPFPTWRLGARVLQGAQGR